MLAKRCSPVQKLTRKVLKPRVSQLTDASTETLGGNCSFSERAESTAGIEEVDMIAEKEG
jgi:hypothetical protein